MAWTKRRLYTDCEEAVDWSMTGVWKDAFWRELGGHIER